LVAFATLMDGLTALGSFKHVIELLYI